MASLKVVGSLSKHQLIHVLTKVSDIVTRDSGISYLLWPSKRYIIWFIYL